MTVRNKLTLLTSQLWFNKAVFVSNKLETQRSNSQSQTWEKVLGSKIRIIRDTIKDEATTWLTSPGNNFCAMPFVHMAIEANGEIKPCCMGSQIGDLNVTGKTVSEAFNDPVRLEFIETFKRNEQHASCEVCWKDPALRASWSTRLHTLPVVLDAMQDIKTEAKLIWLEIKPGNRCNLKCRICGVHNSSSWTKDAAAQNEPNKKFKESNSFKYTQSCDWIEDTNFWNDITQFESIQYIHFMGGEPFMVPEHFQLLERLVDSDIDTSNIIVAYNTNGTYFPTEEQIKLYSNFSSVEFQISIDDVDSRFEYQRKLGNWNEVKENITNFQKEKQHNNNIDAILDPTISIFNLFYLEEIAAEFASMGFTDLSENYHFVNTGYYAIDQLPQPIKDIVTEKYKDNNNVWISNAVKYMNRRPANPKMWIQLQNSTAILDRLRTENLEVVFPEFWKVIQPYWNTDE